MSRVAWMASPLTTDEEGDIFPPSYAQIATVTNWGGCDDSKVNGALVEVVEKGHGYFEVQPLEPIEGWGMERFYCLRSELVAENAFTQSLLDLTEDES